MWGRLGSHDSEEPSMQSISTIGLDITKSVFQVHGVDATEPAPPMQFGRGQEMKLANLNWLR